MAMGGDWAPLRGKRPAAGSPSHWRCAACDGLESATSNCWGLPSEGLSPGSQPAAASYPDRPTPAAASDPGRPTRAARDGPYVRRHPRLRGSHRPRAAVWCPARQENEAAQDRPIDRACRHRKRRRALARLLQGLGQASRRAESRCQTAAARTRPGSPPGAVPSWACCTLLAAPAVPRGERQRRAHSWRVHQHPADAQPRL
mmetsp:Transcript_6378/g.18960  ORF Transcript_6378/g.18960 Transcript_6378/m.18960 type:complete len:201 (-) Transcript_6378:137-739(-)